jgi:hypothetical protein
MKRENIVLSAVIFLLLLFGSCREVTVTTKVNPDGTFTRIITVTGDSAEVMTGDLPYPVDETWTRVFSKDTSDSAKFIQTYSKSFRSSDKLNEEIRNDTGSYSILDRNISVSKKFRFFFSYLTFKEVYNYADAFTGLDYHEFLTEDDIQWFSVMKLPVTPADSLHKKEAEDKVFDFLIASAAAEVEAIMRDGIKKLNNPLLNPVDISQYHDSIYKEINAWNNSSELRIIEDFRRWSGNDAFLLLNDLDPPLFENFVKKVLAFDRVIGLESFTEEVEMPGLITGTNSPMLNGNLVRWDFQPMNVIIRDYEMVVESRVINYWAFIVSGIVLLALVVLLILKAILKQN